MSAQSDLDSLRRRLDTLIRSADRIRRHAADLHDLGWTPHHGDVEKVNGGEVDNTPRMGDPRARRLFDRICVKVSAVEAELVGLERIMVALFTTRAEWPDATRGSTISVEEFDRLRTGQRRRSDTPARLVEQPEHPGRRR